MPSVPEGFDWDLAQPGSRFSPRPALAVAAPEAEWPEGGGTAGAQELIRRRLGSWVFEEQDELGAPEAIEGSFGRGAAGWAAVLEFVDARPALPSTRGFRT